MLGLIASWLTAASLFLFLNIIIGTIAVASRFGSHNTPQQINPPLARAPSLLDRVKSINFYTHKYTTEPENNSNWPDQPPLERAPSLLERFKSINFSTYYGSEAETKFAAEHESVHYTGNDSGSEPVLQRVPSIMERVKSIKLPSFSRSEPETGYAAEPGLDAVHGSDVHAEHHMWRSKSEHKEAPKKRGKMKKSASENAVAVDAVERRQEGEDEVEQRRPATTRVERTVSIGDEGVDAKADDFINRFKQQLKLQRLDSLLRYRDSLQGKQNV